MRIGNRRLKWPAYVLLVILVLIIVIPIATAVINNSNKKKSTEYKLSQLGYSDSDINKIVKLSDESKEYILSNDYNKYYVELINYKYYIDLNFLTYIEYHNKIEDYDVEHIIAYVNTKSYLEEYEDTKQTDISDPILALVNKYYYLPATYKPASLKNVSNWYAYEGCSLDETAYEAYKELYNAAKDDGLSIILARGYRSYKDQKSVYDAYKLDYGEREADNSVPRPGYSEYQTGLSLMLGKLYYTGDFEKTKEFAWLLENAHEYGFVLRYPENKKYITKRSFTPEVFRYVGVEVATIMHDENLTLEEYLAFYLK